MPWLRGLARHAASSLLLAAVTFAVVSSLTPFGAATTPDSIAYLDFASHIRAGDGWALTDRSVAAAGTGKTVENRWWPPLYPAVLAVFVDDERDARGAARLCMLLYFLTALLVYILLVPHMPWVSASLISLGLMLSVPMLSVFCHAWSETLFVPFVLLAVLGASLYLERDAGLRRRILALSLLVAALIGSFYTRYVGLGIAFVLPLTLMMSERRRSDWWFCSIGSAILAVAVVYLCLSNLRDTGSITGMSRQASDLTLGQNLVHVAQSFATMLPKSPAVLLGLGFLALAAMLLTAKHWPSTGRIYGHEPLLLVSAGAIHLATLVAMRTHTRFDEIDVRLVSPAFLPLAIGAVLFAARLSPARVAPLAAKGLVLFLLSAVAVGGYAQFRASAASWIASDDPQTPLRSDLRYANYTFGPAVRMAYRDLLPQGAFMVVDRASVWHFVTGVQTADLPTPLDAAAGAALRRLPAGSVLLLSKSRSQSVISQLVPRRDYTGVEGLGDKVLVRLHPSQD